MFCYQAPLLISYRNYLRYHWKKTEQYYLIAEFIIRLIEFSILEQTYIEH